MKLIKKKKSGKLWHKVFVILIAVIFIISIFPAFLSNSGGGNLDEFAQCITSAGAVMYGVEWCSNCKAQKKMFGNSFQYINHVECLENEALCTEKNITAVPTWIVDEQPYIGLKSLNELSSITNCSFS
jgi:hypothetical protein